MTRRVFVFGLLALFLTAVESALMAAVGFSAGLLLSLGILFLAALRASDIEGAGIAAIVGYGWDVFSGAPIGMSVAPAVVLFVGIRVLSQGVDCAGPIQVAVLGLLAAFFHGLACLGLLALSGSAGELAVWLAVRATLVQSVFAAIVVAPVFKFVCWIDRLIVDDRAESEVWLS